LLFPAICHVFVAGGTARPIRQHILIENQMSVCNRHA
jgi:hypothetical protein